MIAAKRSVRFKFTILIIITQVKTSRDGNSIQPDISAKGKTQDDPKS